MSIDLSVPRELLKTVTALLPPPENQSHKLMLNGKTMIIHLLADGRWVTFDLNDIDKNLSLNELALELVESAKEHLGIE